MPSRIFCAIDTPALPEAQKLAGHLKSHVAGIKLGLEFFSSNGPAGVEALRELGLPLFLDLKLHDIPNTVANAVAALLPLAPQFITLHAAGGPAMMKAAVEAARKGGSARPKLLAVTVLTSLDAPDLKAIGQDASPADQVRRLALLARECGVDGAVCAPTEIALLRRELGQEFILMVPGIRPQSAAANDQKRVMTPGEAVQAGATYLVVGRPITQKLDPAAAAEAINAEVG
ncbi:MAG TPA: orotidine-5'-phosphate decarboxylase [Alphaproteobacteria bacterium]|nr:orotidine-5'-phosphate decarboxylase [Alphaproteobacteria bacterium]